MESKKKALVKKSQGQRTSRDLIRIVSMLLYKQKKDLKLSVSGDKFDTKVLEKMHPNWQYQSSILMHQGYEVAQDDP